MNYFWWNMFLSWVTILIGHISTSSWCELLESPQNVTEMMTMLSMLAQIILMALSSGITLLHSFKYFSHVTQLITEWCHSRVRSDWRQLETWISLVNTDADQEGCVLVSVRAGISLSVFQSTCSESQLSSEDPLLLPELYSAHPARYFLLWDRHMPSNLLNLE